MDMVKLFKLQYVHVHSLIFQAKSNGSIFNFNIINLREHADKLILNKEEFIMFVVQDGQ